MSRPDRLSRILAAPPRAFAALGMALYPVLIFIVLYDVVTRKATTYLPGLSDYWMFSLSTTLQELEWHLHAAVFLFALGYTYLKDAHVRIDIFWASYPARAKRVLEALAIVCFLLPFCAVAFKFGYSYAESAFTTGEGSPSTTGLPQRWIVKSFLPIGLALFALAALVRLREIATGRWPTDDGTLPPGVPEPMRPEGG